ncbi:hypothetical protein QFZ27_007846 [Inquilinus ginsengisoli]|jgi:hypothetical protein|uniref:hypothetical protein n=1 Tax=Inquilinus ginsengisoli TaxID=363840 RepID=UPI003D1C5884
MFIEVAMCGWDKPTRMDGSRPAEDVATPDGNIYGKVIGGDKYEPGPWETVLTGVAEQLRRLRAE